MKSGRKILKGSFLNVCNLVVQVAVGLILMPVMIKAFGDSVFGLWSLVGTFMGYYGLLDLGLASAVNRFISRAIGRRDHGEIKHIVSTAFLCLVFVAIFAVILTFVIFYLAPLLLKQPSELDLFRKLLWIFSLNTLITFPAYVFEGVLFSHLRHDLVSLMKISVTLLRAVLTILVIKLNLGILVIAGITVLSNLIEAIFKILWAKKLEENLIIRFDYFQWSRVREILSYSLYTLVGRIADLLRYNISSILITIFINVAAITHYRVAGRLVEYFLQGMIATTSVLMPYFSQKEGAGDFTAIRNSFNIATKLNVFAATFIGFVLIAYGKFFIVRWVGLDYSDSYFVLVILVVPMTCALIQNATFPLLYGISKHRFLAVMNCAEGICNLIFSLILVKPYGLLGIAMGSAIPMLISKVLIQPFYISKVIGISVREYVIEMIGKPLILCVLILGVPMLMISDLLKPNYLNLLLFVLMQGGVFLTVLYFVGVSHKEKQFVFNVIQGVKT